MFTFTNPWLFWFLPVLALPWIFRRRQEERIRHINFPLIQFLRESEEKELVNPQLQELLLLILRTLLLALLLVSLAGPKWMTASSIQNRLFSMIPFGRSFQNHLIGVDTSYSMGYGEGERSWWREAERIWEAASQQLHGFSTRMVRWDRSTIQPNRENRPIPLSALERDSLFSSLPVEEGVPVLDLFQGIQQISGGNDNVILITDGQRYPWESMLALDAGKENIPNALVITAGSGPVSNVWCEVNILSSPPWGIAGWETLAGNVKALSSEPLPDGAISIVRPESNDTLFSQSVTFPAISGQTLAVPFEFTAQFSELMTARRGMSGDLDLTVRVESEDLLPIDNEINIQIPYISSFSAGLVCAENPAGPVLPVLMSAVNPLRGTIESPPVLIEQISPSNIQYGGNLDMVLLDSGLVSPDMRPDMIPVTLEYIKNGGSVLLFSGGDRSGNESWNELMQALGWRWLDVDSATGTPGPLTVSGSSLLSKALSVWDESMWLSWAPGRHGRVEGESFLPLVSYRVGEQTAYLVSQVSLGKGRVWIVNTSLDSDADTLLSPLLPALIWETGKEISRGKQSKELFIPGGKAESDLTLLSQEEKDVLTERYGIRFATRSTFGEEIDRMYGGMDLRLMLLFVCLLLALLESWLSNHLASL